MKSRKPVTSYTKGFIYAFSHMCVEVACFFWLAYNKQLDPAAWYMVDLAYDAMAFIPQLFVGMLADRFKTVNIGAIGTAMLLCGIIIPVSIPSFFLITIGNCLLHVDGAEMTLRGADGKMGPSGIFVAGGSFGVVLGTLLGKTGNYNLIIIPAMLLAVSLIVLLIVPKIRDGNMRSSGHNALKAYGFHCAAERPLWLIVVLSFVTVAARALVGYAIPTGWNKTAWQTVLLFTCMGLGKGIGGVIADRFGARRTGVLSLLISMPLLMFGDSVMVVSLIGVMFFSMTMAISLGVLVSAFPDNPGFAFGITTVALFAGSAPMFFVKITSVTVNAVLVGLLSAAAAAALWFTASDKNAVKPVAK